MRINTKALGKLLVSILWISVTVYGFYFVYQTISEAVSGKAEWYFPSFSSRNIFLLASIIILMFVNWGIEAYKWKLSIEDIEDQSFFKALKATYVGVAISTWMPNRLGEYLGKVFFVKPENRYRSAISALYVSYTQIIATLSFGLFGAVYFLLTYRNEYNQAWVMASIGVALAMALLILAFKNKVKNLLRLKNRYLRLFVNTLTRYSFTMAAQFIGLSALRFAVFTIQFIIALSLFGVNAPIFELFLMISLLFGLQTVIPASALAGLGIRGVMSVFFLGFLSTNEVGILSASYFLWFVNLLLPSAMGLFALLASPVRLQVKEQVWHWVKTKSVKG